MFSCKISFRLVLSIIEFMDHSFSRNKISFLQNRKIDRDVYLKLPKETETLKLWKLSITAYGLCDAHCAWRTGVQDVLITTGVKKSEFDDSIFYWGNNDKSEGLICCHVDDFFWGRTKHFAETLINMLKEKILKYSEKLLWKLQVHWSTFSSKGRLCLPRSAALYWWIKASWYSQE